ncbi:DUF2730 family protein [Agarivorans sp. QJM3NY_25]|uniref:DUF2730 family protein n=1 Tax=Agarivorans sp. QJM3NY_25 TaxID=3421430 RepID=UPI003D7DBDEB
MNKVNWNEWMFYLNLAQAVATVVLFIWVYLTRGQKHNSEELNGIKQRLGNVEQRQVLLENNMTHLPNKDEVHQLDRRLADLSAGLSAATEQMRRLEKKTDLLLENELRGES